MKKYDESYNGEIEDVVLDKYDKETLDRISSCLSEIGVYSNQGVKKEIRRMFNDMIKDKVKQFVDLLLDGESVENAMDKSGIGEMKVADVLKAIACSEYIEEMSKIFVNTKEVIQTVKDLDEALLELKKSSDK